jgi:hypothetical protein
MTRAEAGIRLQWSRSESNCGNLSAVISNSLVARAIVLRRCVDLENLPPLTIGDAASYDRVEPIHTNVPSSIGANVDVSRTDPAHPGRGWMYFLSAVLCLLGGVNTTQAAGCHMQDRIALGSTPTWEKELEIDLSVEPLVQLPPVLAVPPCRGEVPHVVDFESTRTSATLVGGLRFDPPRLSDFNAFQSPSEPIRPRLLRLDRPPRTSLLCAAVRRSA